MKWIKFLLFLVELNWTLIEGILTWIHLAAIFVNMIVMVSLKPSLEFVNVFWAAAMVLGLCVLICVIALEHKSRVELD
jgi:hypothetical protein